MSRTEELGKELREFFPDADIQVTNDSVYITQGTFYTRDRRELERLEKKYEAGLWCDARDGKVFYDFHTFGGWKYGKKYTDDEIFEAAWNALRDISHHDITEMYWDTLTDKEKRAQGLEILRARNEETKDE